MLRRCYGVAVALNMMMALTAGGCLTGEAMVGEPSAEAPTASPPESDPATPLRPDPGPLKAAPVRPPDVPGVVTDGTLADKPGRHQPTPLSPTGWSVAIAASPTFLWPTQFSTVTATANMDVGPTPYYIRITSGGAIVASCGSGTTCSFTVMRSSADSVLYTANITDFSGTAIDSEPFGTNFTWVTWHDAGVELTASPPTVPLGGSATLAATMFYDIGPSPFYVEFFEDATGTYLGACGSGTSCSTTVTQSVAGTHGYKACFSSFGTSFPPPNLLECTPVAYVTWSSSGATVSLTAPALTFGSETVTATSSFDVGPTPYYLQIYDLDAGTRIAVCGSGTSCSTSFLPSSGGSHLIAFIASSSTTLPPPSAQAQSAIVTTTREVIR